MSMKSRVTGGFIVGCATVALVLASVAPALAASSPTAIDSRQSPTQKADAAVAGGSEGVEEALRSGDVAVANELLKRASETDSQSASPSAPGDVTALTACHGAVKHRTTIALLGVTFGWREVRVAGWCWGGGRITSWQGASYNKYSSFPYCWTNESTHDGWYNFPTRRYAYTRGTLGNNTGFGCIASGNTIVPAVYYRDGGSWSYTP